VQYTYLARLFNECLEENNKSMVKIHIKPLLRTIETAARENATREKEQKSAFSLAWNTKEFEKTDKNQLGPTLFSSPQN
jgi:hypothetical protein